MSNNPDQQIKSKNGQSDMEELRTILSRPIIFRIKSKKKN